MDIQLLQLSVFNAYHHYSFKQKSNQKVEQETHHKEWPDYSKGHLFMPKNCPNKHNKEPQSNPNPFQRHPAQVPKYQPSRKIKLRKKPFPRSDTPSRKSRASTTTQHAIGVLKIHAARGIAHTSHRRRAQSAAKSSGITKKRHHPHHATAVR